MQATQRNLIAINVIGGTLVLGSYLWGFLAQPQAMDALWGGVPESARSLYTVNMFLAAFGYMLFTPYIVFKLVPTLPASLTWPSFYLAIMIASALWLPLTSFMVENPSSLLWWLIRIDLAAVALGAAGLLVSLLLTRTEARVRGHGWAVLGLLPFCLQTVVLDAIVWPLYFPTEGV